MYVWQFDTQLSSHWQGYQEGGPTGTAGPGRDQVWAGKEKHAGEGQARRWLPVASRAADVFLPAVTSSGVSCEVRWKAAARDLAF